MMFISSARTTADGPADEDAAGVCAAGCHVSCGGEDAAADGGADDHGGEFREAEGLVLRNLRAILQWTVLHRAAVVIGIIHKKPP